MRKGIVFIMMLCLAVSPLFAGLEWCGDSFIIVNELWYTGSHSYVHEGGYFEGASLGELSSLTLGGNIKSWDSSGDAAYLHYTIDDDINGFIALSETWVSGGDRYFQEDPGDAVDLSGLTPGSHTLAVWFEVKDTDPDPELSVWDDRDGTNYNATFTIADDTALPVELTDFSARCLRHAVELTWRTASETENRAFRIYRNGVLLVELEGAGTSSEPRSYRWTDAYVIPGETYRYVPADVDLQGKETKYNEVEVKVKAEVEVEVEDEALLRRGFGEYYNIGSAHPNPFNPVTVIPLNLAADACVCAFLYDISGQRVRELYNASLPAGSHDLTIDGADLPTGLYFVQVNVNNVVNVRKIALMK